MMLINSTWRQQKAKGKLFFFLFGNFTFLFKSTFILETSKSLAKSGGVAEIFVSLKEEASSKTAFFWQKAPDLIRAPRTLEKN